MGFDSGGGGLQSSSDVDHQKTTNRTHSGDSISPNSISTDSATINGLPGVPIADEESGSPYTATGSNSATSITPSNLDAFDSYWIYCKATDLAGDGANVKMQVGGDTGSNYDGRQDDGTNNSGQTEFNYVNVGSSNATGAFWIQLFNRKDTVGMSVLSEGFAATNIIRGRNENVTWPPSQFTFKRGVDTDWEVRVWGRDI